MIDATYTVTSAEYVEAQLLFIRQNGRKRRLRRLIALVICLVGISINLFASWADGTTAREPCLWAIPLVVLLGIFGFPFLQKVMLRKRFALEAGSIRDLHIRIDEDGYRGEVPGVGQGFVQWSAFTHWMEGRLVFILMRPTSLQIISKAALTPLQMDEFRQLASAHIPAALTAKSAPQPPPDTIV